MVIETRSCVCVIEDAIEDVFLRMCERSVGKSLCTSEGENSGLKIYAAISSKTSAYFGIFTEASHRLV